MDTRRNDLVVFEIQTYLRELYKAGYALPLITPDGIYGKLTTDAVRDFQRIEGLDQSGEVDFNTWNTLVFEANRIRSIYALPEKISPFDMLMLDGSSQKGDKFDLIYIIQIMLRALHVYDYQSVQINGVFDEATSDALDDFSLRNGINNQSGVITKEVWDALAIAYSQYILKNPGD